MLKTFLQHAHYQIYEYSTVERLIQERFSGKKVLDVGCGTGKYLNLFRRYGCAVTGIDLNPEQVKALQESGYMVYLPDDLPETETFDVIFMSHVIEHLPALIRFLEKYLSMLAKGGRLVIISPVAGERFYYDFSHVRPYYPQSIRMLLGEYVCAASYKSPLRTELDDIYFFNDSIRLRGQRYFYPCTARHEPAWKYRLISGLVSAFNMAFALVYRCSGGRVGVKASWLGIYSKKEDQ